MSRRKGQLLLTVFLIILIFSVGTRIVNAAETRAGESEEETDEIQRHVEEALLSEFDFDEIEKSLQDMFPGEKITFQDVVGSLMSGDMEETGELLIGFLKDLIAYEFHYNMHNLIYILLISRTKDIKRTFMYHGAEHKCINCIEHGLELNVENVRKSSKQHKRCGTSFLFFVMIVSIIFCFFITAESQVARVLIRIALFPFIAGVSYEIIRLAGNSDNVFINLLSRPGMWVQNMTTKEPDDSMIEVGIRAVEAVFDWRTWQKENL